MAVASDCINRRLAWLAATCLPLMTPALPAAAADAQPPASIEIIGWSMTDRWGSEPHQVRAGQKIVCNIPCYARQRTE